MIWYEILVPLVPVVTAAEIDHLGRALNCMVDGTVFCSLNNRLNIECIVRLLFAYCRLYLSSWKTFSNV